MRLKLFFVTLVLSLSDDPPLFSSLLLEEWYCAQCCGGVPLSMREHSEIACSPFRLKAAPSQGVLPILSNGDIFSVGLEDFHGGTSRV